MNNSYAPAMPFDSPRIEGGKRFSGLTKMEHYAGLAMQGLISDSKITGTMEDFACRSVLLADALLKELEKCPI